MRLRHLLEILTVEYDTKGLMLLCMNTVNILGHFNLKVRVYQPL